MPLLVSFRLFKIFYLKVEQNATVYEISLLKKKMPAAVRYTGI